MDLEKYARLYKQFNELLEDQKTRRPKQFAKRLGVSERTLSRIINSFNRNGHEINLAGRMRLII